MQLGHRSPPGSARSSSGRKRRFKHLNIEQGINNDNIAPGRHLVVISINITRSVMATPPHRQAANYPLLPPDTPASTEPAKRRNSIISDFVFSVGEFKSLRPAASRAQRSADTASLGRREQVAPAPPRPSCLFAPMCPYFIMSHLGSETYILQNCES